MIVSHRHRFIFVKTRKTAGTSLEIALSAHCGPDDILGTVSAIDDRARRDLGYPGPQNNLVPLSQYTCRNVAGSVLHRRRRRFRPHVSAAQIRRTIGDRTWDEYFTFTIERNSFDKALSRYWWQTRNESDRASPNEFLQTVEAARLSDWHLYTLDGEIAVDQVLRYEDLPSELDGLSDRLGLEITLPAIRAKGEHRRDRRHYTQVLDAAARARIMHVCRREIAAFGYEWGS